MHSDPTQTAVVNVNSGDSALTRRRLPIAVYAQCQTCRDSLDIFFWIRETKHKGIFNARMEPQAAIELKNGQLVHNKPACRGIFKLIHQPMQLVVEGEV